MHGDNFVFETLIRTENHLLLRGRRICHYLMKRIMALQQMINKKKSRFHFLGDFVAFEDCPIWHGTKIVKS